METGIEIITKEQQRQRTVKGWTPEHDSTHTNEELARAAMCYAMPYDLRIKAVWGDGRMLRFYQPGNQESIELYPDGWKMKPTPNDRIKELAKAGALIASEIDRLILKEQEK